MPRLLLALVLLVVLADLAQPLLLPWEPRFVAALGGAAIYGAAAAGLVAGARWPLAVVGLMPLIPWGALLAWSLGAPLPLDPSAWMVGIAGVQLAAGGVAWRLMWTRSAAR
ncbi:MAG: hypothetical protein H6732_13405 [Alphaproteobacteria bacterium]|nr:hypothetical protein [Alphaproteobacteria bacterium]